MLQIIIKVVIAAKGSRTAVSGCGTISMSLSLIRRQPRMLEPSNPNPSSKTSSSSLFTGIVKCCHRPGKSMKRISTDLTPFSRQNANTSFGVTSSSFREESRQQLQSSNTQQGPKTWRRLPWHRHGGPVARAVWSYKPDTIGKLPGRISKCLQNITLRLIVRRLASCCRWAECSRIGQ